ncbi:MAG: hypothetical protein EB127_20365, partial [Alphaproteobacteria bacterium]|nr:hypothetical protein [Alphaproteobacteria bacterium]
KITERVLALAFLKSAKEAQRRKGPSRLWWLNYFASRTRVGRKKRIKEAHGACGSTCKIFGAPSKAALILRVKVPSWKKQPTSPCSESCVEMGNLLDEA